MHFNKLLQMLDGSSYLSVGLDVGADFTLSLIHIFFPGS